MIKKIIVFLSSLRSNSRKLKVLTEVNNQNHLIVSSLLKEINWSNVFNSAISGSTWLYNTPLNVGRWAANYSFLYILYRILNEIKPDNILEFGLGETTMILQSYKKLHNKKAYCVTVENSDEWIEMRLKNGLSTEIINILKLEIDEIIFNNVRTNAYKNLTDTLISFDRKFNLIIVDGPLGCSRYSRTNIIDLVSKKLLHDDFIIIMDDYNRNGEKETFEELKKVLAISNFIFEIGYYSGTKDQVILVSKKFKYLTSL